jgi:hypothetical protein
MITDVHRRIRDAHVVLSQLLAHSHYGLASQTTVTPDGVRVSVDGQHTQQPAAVLLAWAELFINPTITGKRADVAFTLMTVHGSFAGHLFTVTAQFGGNEIDQVLHEQCGDLTVDDLRQLASAGAR